MLTVYFCYVSETVSHSQWPLKFELTSSIAYWIW